MDMFPGSGAPIDATMQAAAHAGLNQGLETEVGNLGGGNGGIGEGDAENLPEEREQAGQNEVDGLVRDGDEVFIEPEFVFGNDTGVAVEVPSGSRPSHTGIFIPEDVRDQELQRISELVGVAMDDKIAFSERIAALFALLEGNEATAAVALPVIMEVFSLTDDQLLNDTERKLPDAEQKELINKRRNQRHKNLKALLRSDALKAYLNRANSRSIKPAAVKKITDAMKALYIYLINAKNLDPAKKLRQLILVLDYLDDEKMRAAAIQQILTTLQSVKQHPNKKDTEDLRKIKILKRLLGSSAFRAAFDKRAATPAMWAPFRAMITELNANLAVLPAEQELDSMVVLLSYIEPERTEIAVRIILNRLSNVKPNTRIRILDALSSSAVFKSFVIGKNAILAEQFRDIVGSLYQNVDIEENCLERFRHLVVLLKYLDIHPEGFSKDPIETLPAAELALLEGGRLDANDFNALRSTLSAYVDLHWTLDDFQSFSLSQRLLDCVLSVSDAAQRQKLLLILGRKVKAAYEKLEDEISSAFEVGAPFMDAPSIQRYTSLLNGMWDIEHTTARVFVLCARLTLPAGLFPNFGANGSATRLSERQAGTALSSLVHALNDTPEAERGAIVKHIRAILLTTASTSGLGMGPVATLARTLANSALRVANNTPTTTAASGSAVASDTTADGEIAPTDRTILDLVSRQMLSDTLMEIALQPVQQLRLTQAYDPEPIFSILENTLSLFISSAQLAGTPGGNLYATALEAMTQRMTSPAMAAQLISVVEGQIANRSIQQPPGSTLTNRAYARKLLRAACEKLIQQLNTRQLEETEMARAHRMTALRHIAITLEAIVADIPEKERSTSQAKKALDAVLPIIAELEEGLSGIAPQMIDLRERAAVFALLLQSTNEETRIRTAATNLGLDNFPFLTGGYNSLTEPTFETLRYLVTAYVEAPFSRAEFDTQNLAQVLLNAIQYLHDETQRRALLEILARKSNAAAKIFTQKLEAEANNGNNPLVDLGRIQTIIESLERLHDEGYWATEVSMLYSQLSLRKALLSSRTTSDGRISTTPFSSVAAQLRNWMLQESSRIPTSASAASGAASASVPSTPVAIASIGGSATPSAASPAGAVGTTPTTTAPVVTVESVSSALTTFLTLCRNVANDEALGLTYVRAMVTSFVNDTTSAQTAASRQALLGTLNAIIEDALNNRLMSEDMAVNSNDTGNRITIPHDAFEAEDHQDDVHPNSPAGEAADTIEKEDAEDTGSPDSEAAEDVRRTPVSVDEFRSLLELIRLKLQLERASDSANTAPTRGWFWSRGASAPAATQLDSDAAEQYVIEHASDGRTTQLLLDAIIRRHTEAQSAASPVVSRSAPSGASGSPRASATPVSPAIGRSGSVAESVDSRMNARAELHTAAKKLKARAEDPSNSLTSAQRVTLLEQVKMALNTLIENGSNAAQATLELVCASIVKYEAIPEPAAASSAAGGFGAPATSQAAGASPTSPTRSTDPVAANPVASVYAAGDLTIDTLDSTLTLILARIAQAETIAAGMAEFFELVKAVSLEPNLGILHVERIVNNLITVLRMNNSTVNTRNLQAFLTELAQNVLRPRTITATQEDVNSLNCEALEIVSGDSFAKLETILKILNHRAQLEQGFVKGRSLSGLLPWGSSGSTTVSVNPYTPIAIQFVMDNLADLDATITFPDGHTETHNFTVWALTTLVARSNPSEATVSALVKAIQAHIQKLNPGATDADMQARARVRAVCVALQALAGPDNDMLAEQRVHLLQSIRQALVVLQKLGSRKAGEQLMEVDVLIKQYGGDATAQAASSALAAGSSSASSSGEASTGVPASSSWISWGSPRPTTSAGERSEGSSESLRLVSAAGQSRAASDGAIRLTPYDAVLQIEAARVQLIRGGREATSVFSMGTLPFGELPRVAANNDQGGGDTERLDALNDTIPVSNGAGSAELTQEAFASLHALAKAYVDLASVTRQAFDTHALGLSLVRFVNESLPEDSSQRYNLLETLARRSDAAGKILINEINKMIVTPGDNETGSPVLSANTLRQIAETLETIWKSGYQNADIATLIARVHLPRERFKSGLASGALTRADLTTVYPRLIHVLLHATETGDALLYFNALCTEVANNDAPEAEWIVRALIDQLAKDKAKIDEKRQKELTDALGRIVSEILLTYDNGETQVDSSQNLLDDLDSQETERTPAISREVLASLLRILDSRVRLEEVANANRTASSGGILGGLFGRGSASTVAPVNANAPYSDQAVQFVVEHLPTRDAAIILLDLLLAQASGNPDAQIPATMLSIPLPASPSLTAARGRLHDAIKAVKARVEDPESTLTIDEKRIVLHRLRVALEVLVHRQSPTAQATLNFVNALLMEYSLASNAVHGDELDTVGRAFEAATTQSGNGRG